MTTDSSAHADLEHLIGAAHFDDSHLWVLARADGTARCGFDPLGVETSGDIVAVSFEPVGSRIERGSAFGNIEAAKFVGPLIAPVSGILTAHNADVLAEPTLLHDDPAHHWLVQLELTDAARELGLLRHGEESVRRWMESETRRFKQRGMIAE